MKSSMVASIVGALATMSCVEAQTADSLRCVSTGGERQHCAAYTGGGVALQRSIGSEHCLLGRNWGYDATGVWVTEGCGAEFALGNPSAEQQRLAATPFTPAATAVELDTSGNDTIEAPGEYTFYSRFGAQAAHENGETQG